MSESLSNLQLKKRLLGAAILVLLAAVIIPFLLGEPKHLEAPVEEVVSTEFQSKIQPLNNTPGTTPAGAGDVPASQSNESGLVLKRIDQIQPLDRSNNNSENGGIKIEPLKLDTLNNDSRKKPETGQTSKTAAVTSAPAKAAPVKKVVVAPKTTAAVKKTQEVKKAPVVKSGWAVQVGIFSKKSNADSFAATLRGDGYQPKISDAKSGSGNTNKRVWLGPFSSKSEARAISEKFEKQTGNDGYVAPYPFK